MNENYDRLMATDPEFRAKMEAIAAQWASVFPQREPEGQ